MQRRTRVKICGIGRLEDATVAVNNGVDALGFIFFAKSPRNILPEDAAEIIAGSPLFVDKVGVFVDAPQERVVEYAQGGLTCIQLHGTESVEYCTKLREHLPFCQIIKAFRVSEESISTHFEPYNICVDAFLLDTYIQGAKGGTGLVFDWSIVPKLRLRRQVILAGGLSLENIAEAISAVRPYAVDINSGVEDGPGIKNHDKIKKILRVVQSADVRMPVM